MSEALLALHLLLDHTPSRIEKIHPLDQFVESLHPEIAIDRAIAAHLDLVSVEANSPYVHEKPAEESHTGMNPEELEAWMRDSGEHRLRVLRVDRATYDQVVDTQALHRIWEMNFWVVPGAQDDAVKSLVSATLREFTKTRSQETTTVMFADASDLADGHREKTGVPVTLQALRDKKYLDRAEAGLQDTRVLKTLGFKRAGSIWFDQRIPSSPMDQAYVLTLPRNK